MTKARNKIKKVFDAKSFLANINKLSKFGTKKAYSTDKSMKVVLAREANHLAPKGDCPSPQAHWLRHSPIPCLWW